MILACDLRYFRIGAWRSLTYNGSGTWLRLVRTYGTLIFCPEDCVLSTNCLPAQAITPDINFS